MDNPGTNLSLAGACRQGGKLTMSLFVLLAICLLGRPAEAQYGGGTGEPNDPYLIYTAEQMNAIGANPNDWDKHFKLMADIDLSRYTGTSFNIIGYFLDRYDKKPFSGVFEGNGHTISNFSYTSTDRNYIGLFGCIDGENAEIRDLGVIEPNVVARTSSGVGSLVGTLKEGTITNCYAKAGSVVCLIFVGGLVGENSGKIANCYASGGVEGTIAGGLVGINQGIIGNCYSSGEVSGHRKIGGLVGRNGAYPPPSAGTITNCYSVSSVTGTTDVGGMVGLNDGDMVTDSFWDTLTSGQATSACGTGLTTAEMQMQSTFIDAGWDFVNAPDRPSDIWCICDGTNYPRFVWQIHGGFFIIRNVLVG